MFADPMQDVYHSNAAEENHKAPKKPFYEDLWDAREITLDKNCRNTKKVAEYVKEIKETNTSVFEEAPQGIYPQILLPTKQPEKSLEKIVNNILTSREYPWPASSIAILVMGRNDLESLENQTFHGNIGTAVYDSEKRNEEEVLTQWCSSKKILVSTIHSFKGLEADIIILYNFDSKFQSNDEKIDTLAYVGSSRPHGALYIIPKDSISRAYVESFLQHQDKSL